MQWVVFRDQLHSPGPLLTRSPFAAGGRDPFLFPPVISRLTDPPYFTWSSFEGRLGGLRLLLGGTHHAHVSLSRAPYVAPPPQPRG